MVKKKVTTKNNQKEEEESKVGGGKCNKKKKKKMEEVDIRDVKAESECGDREREGGYSYVEERKSLYGEY